MSKTKYKEPKYIQWIRNRMCDFCGKADRWDTNLDLPINTPFHLKTRGSGGVDFDNTVTACFKCHVTNEPKKNVKDSMKELAVKLTLEYKEKYASKLWWENVRNLQNG